MQALFDGFYSSSRIELTIHCEHFYYLDPHGDRKVPTLSIFEVYRPYVKENKSMSKCIFVSFDATLVYTSKDRIIWPAVKVQFSHGHPRPNLGT